MFLCSRQIGPAIVGSDLVASLKSVHDLRALVLPLGVHQRREISANRESGIGGRGKRFAELMPQLRTLLYVDPQMSVAVALGEEPWRDVAESIGASLMEADLGSVLVGRVVGDDLTAEIDALLAAGCDFANTSSGRPFSDLAKPIHSIRIALGAAPYVHAVAEGCRVVLGGMVSPGAMTMGFLHSDQRIARRDWHTLANLTIHAILMEQASLAMELSEEGIPSLHHAPWTKEISGHTDISLEATSLETSVRHALEQLKVPGKLRSPDVSFEEFTAGLQAGPPGGITLAGIKGGPPPAELPVDIVYRAGYRSDLVVSFAGRDRGDNLDHAIRQLGMFPEARELDGAAGVRTHTYDRVDNEVPTHMLTAELFSPSEVEVAAMYGAVCELLSKVPGCSFHSAELPDIFIDYQRWPTVVPRSLVEWDVEIRAAADWA